MLKGKKKWPLWLHARWNQSRFVRNGNSIMQILIWTHDESTRLHHRDILRPPIRSPCDWIERFRRWRIPTWLLSIQWTDGLFGWHLCSSSCDWLFWQSVGSTYSTNTSPTRKPSVIIASIRATRKTIDSIKCSSSRSDKKEPLVHRTIFSISRQRERIDWSVVQTKEFTFALKFHPIHSDGTIKLSTVTPVHRQTYG